MQNPQIGELAITFLGQACTQIQYGSISIISDPWFSPSAHLNSWIRFPLLDSEETLRQREKIDSATHIYLSHDHDDHFDPEFLATLSPKEILVADFCNQKFRSALLNLSPHHRIRFIGDGESHSLENEVRLRVFREKPYYRTNSVMLIETPQGRILNANDCALNTELLRQIGDFGKVGLLLYTLNFLANGYPLPYLRKCSIDFNEKISELRQGIMDSFRTAIHVLNPNAAAAFAGPVNFAHTVNSHYNTIAEGRDWSKMIQELNTTTPVFWPPPFSEFRLFDNSLKKISESKSWDTYFKQSEGKSLTQPTATELYSAEVPFDKIISTAKAFLNDLVKLSELTQLPLSTKLLLSAVSRMEDLESSVYLWTIELNFQGTVKVIASEESASAPFLHLVSTPELLLAFLKGSINIDDFLLSSHGRFSRVPDSFDPTLHNFLRFGLDPLSRQALIAHQSTVAKKDAISQRFPFHDGNQLYEIPKYCPHEGESLEHACIENGVITCPRHKWKYDLKSGKCLSGDKRVNLYKASPESSAQHYLTDEIDPIYLRASRDLLGKYLQKGRILNVGLGYGVWDELLAETKSEILGVDNNPELVKRFSAAYPQIQYVASDIYQFNPKVRFDTIIACHFLEHVESPVPLLNLFSSWLAKNGVILIAVPNAESLHRRIGVELGIIDTISELSQSDLKLGHKRVYTQDSLRVELEDGGLQILKMGGVSFKAMNNSQLATMPRAYVEACAHMTAETDRFAAQIYAVATLKEIKT